MTPDYVRTDQYLNDDHERGDQVALAGAVLEYEDPDDGPYYVSAWRDEGVPGGAIRFEIGYDGDLEDLSDDEASVGTAVTDPVTGAVTFSAPGAVVGGPQVVALGGRDFAILWTGLDADGQARAYEQRFTYNPDAAVELTRGEVVDLGAAADVAVVDLAGGSHAVLALSGAGITLRVTDDATGAAVGRTIALPGAAGAADPDLVALGSAGRVVAAYENGSGGLTLAVVDTATGTVGAGLTLAGVSSPALVALADGRVALAFVEGEAVKVRLFTVDAAGALTQDGPDILAPHGPEAGGAQRGPDLVAMLDGGFVLGWSEVTPEGPVDGTTGSMILGQRYGAGGDLLGDVFSLGDDDDELEEDLALVDAGDNRFAAFYASTDVDYDPNDPVTFGPVGSTWVAPRLVTGSDGDDVIQGTSAADAIDAGAGNDTVYGNGGGDIIRGGAGDDLLFTDAPNTPGSGSEAFLYGGDGNDRLVSGARSWLYGEAGNDEIDGSDTDDVIFAGTGDDIVRAGDGSDRIEAGEGRDTVLAGGDNDRVALTYDGLADTVDGGTGPYSYYSPEADELTLDLTAAERGVTFDPAAGTITLPDGTTITGFERYILTGSRHADVLIGGHQIDGEYYAGDALRGGAGDDAIQGGAGNDQLDGGAGADTVSGGTGNDTVTVRAGEGGDLLNGGSQVYSVYQPGYDTLVLDYRDSTVGIVGDLSQVTRSSLTGTGQSLSDGTRAYDFETVHAELGGGDDALTLGDGDDTLEGGDGDDHLAGGAGDDRISGGRGADVLQGGAGDDTISITNFTTGASIDGEEAGDRIDGGEGTDELTLDWALDQRLVLEFTGTELVFGRDARAVNIEALTVYGSNLADRIITGDGDDFVTGRGGGDYVSTGGGADRINAYGAAEVYAGSGDDKVELAIETPPQVVDGGEGTDLLKIDAFSLRDGPGLQVDLAAGTIGASRVTGFERLDLRATFGDDRVVGGTGADIIIGYDGADHLEGRGGDDTLDGGSGHDTVDGGDGDDTLWGLDGDDVMIGGRGTNAIDAGRGNDRVVTTGADTIRGGTGADVVEFASGRGEYDVAYTSWGPWWDAVRGYALTHRATGATTRVAEDVETYTFAGQSFTAAEVLSPPARAVDDGARLGEDDLRVTRDAAGGVLANDYGEGAKRVTAVDGLAAGTAVAGQYGTLVLNADGSYTYTLSDRAQELRIRETGGDIFTYTLTDGRGLTHQGRLAVTVDGADDRPVLGADTLRAVEDTALVLPDASALMANDRDPDRHEGLALVGVGGATHGTVALDALGRITFNPDKDFAGEAGFTYTVRDVHGAEFTGNVTVVVEPVNDAPVAAVAAESFAGLEDVAVQGRVLAGTDADGDALTYRLVEGSATHGRVALDASGAFTFTSDADYHGAAEFRYVVSDGRGGTSEAKLVTLALASVNDGPVAVGDSGFVTDQGKALTLQASALLGNDSDPDGGTLRILSVGGGQGGTAALVEGGVVFTPGAGHTGAASFTYTVSDGQGGTATASVGLVVRAVDSGLVTLNGTERADLLRGTAKAEAIWAKGGADLVYAGAGHDEVHGGEGWDLLFGGDGDDKLWGDAGNDALSGDAGADTLDGGAGLDLLTGGAGADTFVFRKGFGTDTVLDFRAGAGPGDVLDVRDLGFKDLAAVKLAATEFSVLGVANTVVDAGAEGTLTLVNVRLNQLVADDFLFA